MKNNYNRIKISMAVLCLSGVLSACEIPDIPSVKAIWHKQEETVKVSYEMPAAGEALLVRDDYHKEQNLKDTFTIVAVGSPYEEILTKAKSLLEKKGYGLEIVLCEDYHSPNKLLQEGKIEGNFFQHKAHLERYNIENNTVLEESAEIFFQPMGIFPGKKKQLSQLSQGTKILVPQEITGFARSLFLLQQEGILGLLSDTDLLAEEADITENPYGVTLIKCEEEKIWERKEEADFFICTMGYVLAAGEHPGKLALAVEKEDSLAAQNLSQILVVKGEKKRMEPLVQILCSKEMEKFVEEYYRGSLQFIGERKGTEKE